MKEILIGILIAAIPQLLTLLSSQGITRLIGGKISKFLRKISRRTEIQSELTALDLVIGMREDNGDVENSHDLKKVYENIRETEFRKL